MKTGDLRAFARRSVGQVELNPLGFFARFLGPGSMPEAHETYLQFRRACLETLFPVLMVSVLIGATATLMGYHAFEPLGTQDMIGSYAGLVALRELAPLLAGAMIAAKPGTALAAALATMRDSEQIEALEVIGVDPYRYLLWPRVAALILAAPALIVFADVAAIGSSWATAVLTLDVASGTFLVDLTRFVNVRDLWCGMVKVVAFAALTGGVSAYFGYAARGGPMGVSRAITWSMVVTTLAIVITNLALSFAFYG